MALKTTIVNFQLGKKGLTEEFIDQLRTSFKRHKTVKISLLKNYSRDKSKIEEDAEKLCKTLSNKENYKYRLIGFTLIIKKQ
jgi:RNA-binding protein YhbY